MLEWAVLLFIRLGQLVAHNADFSFTVESSWQSLGSVSGSGFIWVNSRLFGLLLNLQDMYCS